MSVSPVRAIATLVTAMAVLTACGGDSTDDDSAAAPAETSAESSAPASESAAESEPADSDEAQTITATEGEMYIELDSEELSAGSTTIEVVNEGAATHDLIVERDGEDVDGTDGIAPGESATLTVDLEPGEYVFYCSVGNHRSLGMEVTVTVT